jgi:NAD(P)-dependent dehydrogenase (short-subunit alcohol dehydrogenase family)
VNVVARTALLAGLLACGFAAGSAGAGETAPAAATVPAVATPPEAPPNPGTALVTGSDRGIGLALVREFARRGWRVIATCRDPAKATELAALARDNPKVGIEALDVGDDAAIDALAKKLKGEPIDALVNNAGVTGSLDAQTLGKLDAADFSRVLRINSYAPLRVAAAFLDQVAASRQRKVIGISSGYASLASVDKIAARGYPTAYFYAMSKAALNMAMRGFAFEAAPRGVTTALIAPGAVDTDMQRGIRGYVAEKGGQITMPALTPEESAHAMVLTIEALAPAQNGHFLARDGSEIPW